MKNLSKEYIEQLIIDELTGDISAEDHLVLQQLLIEDEASQALYEQYKASMQTAKAINFLTKIDEDAAWSKINERIAPAIEEPKTAKMINFKKWLVAASILLPLAIVGVLLVRNYSSKDQLVQLKPSTEKVKLLMSSGESITLEQHSKNKTVTTGGAVLHDEQGMLNYELKGEQSALSYNTLIVPRTKDYKIKLSDGTEVWLNSESELKFPLTFEADKRVVYLKGEAYFKVAKDAKKPFTVKVNNLDVQVLGTSFNVNSYSTSELKVALVEGSVKLNAGGKESLLKPGLMATYSPGNGFSQNRFDDQQVLSWMNGLYYFNNANLREIAQIVERWYDVKLEVDDPAIWNTSISGAIEKNKHLEGFLENLTIISQVQYRIKDNQTIVLSK